MKKKILIIMCSLLSFSVIVFGVGFYVFKDVISTNGTFKSGTKINGVDVSGLKKNEAENIIATRLGEQRKDISITLMHKGRIWNWKGEDFEIDNQVAPYVQNVFDYFNSGNLIERKIKLVKLDGNRNFNISYKSVLTGLETKIDVLKKEIDILPQDAKVVFDAKKKNPVSYLSEVNGEVVDSDLLIKAIDEKMQLDTKIDIEIPMLELRPNVLMSDIENSVVKRGDFSTSYSKSTQDRKFNVKHALDVFNGMQILPMQEISFNSTTGARTTENGYKKANIILNGVYVEGTGGGVCQASTTLYNALLNADLEITEVNKHTLPSSYIWLAFDAMVSEGYSDLKFKNNTDNIIYVKTYSDENNVYVEIYGQPFKEGERVVRQVEFIRAIPHNGDKVVADTQGQYTNKITFKGEYLRLKYPREGYEAKGYIDRYVNDVLVEEKLIRHEIYEPQQGIIIEGVEELSEGMTLPPNNVKIIPPQEKTEVDEKNAQKKIENDNPIKYNP